MAKEKYKTLEKTCKTCENKYMTFPYGAISNYCSRDCKTESMKGSSGYWLGKTRTHMVGAKNWDWKGNSVGYRALHRWVERWLGKPCKCEFCGVNKTTPRSMHWANKSHKYLRNLKDWISLCVKCHKQYDKKTI